MQWITGQNFAAVTAFTSLDRAPGEPDNQITVLGRLDGDGHVTVRATREIASAENNLKLPVPATAPVLKHSL